MTGENKNKKTEKEKREKKRENEIRATEAIVSGLKTSGRPPKPSDYQKVMKEVQDKDITSKNAPGGVFNKGGKAMKPITMNMGGQVEGVEDLTTEFEVTD